MLKVRELIEQLETLDLESDVYVEGCDCVAPATKATQDDEYSVMIER